MQIEIAESTERLVRHELSHGQFLSVDELIQAGIEALHAKDLSPAELPSSITGVGDLADLFKPVRGLLTDEEIDLYFSRDRSPDRNIELE